MANYDSRAQSPTCDNTRRHSGKARPVHAQRLGKVADRFGVMKSKKPSGSTPQLQVLGAKVDDGSFDHLRLSVTKMTKGRTGRGRGQ
jgi:hypothetical protein